MIWTTEFSGKFPAKARFGDCFSSYTATDLGYLKEKEQPNKQNQKNWLPLGWEAVALHHPVAAPKNQPEIPVVARRPLGHTVWFCQSRKWKRWGRGILEKANSAPPELEQPGDGQRQPFCWWRSPLASISVTSGGVSTLQWASSSGYQPLQTAALKNSSSVITHVGGKLARLFLPASCPSSP